MPQDQDAIEIAHIVSERAVDELRRQMGLIIQKDTANFDIAYPAEFLTETLLSWLKSLPHTRLMLLITGTRAEAIGHAANGVQTLEIDAEGLSLGAIDALTNPLSKEKRLPTIMKPADKTADMVITLAKQASLLPALIVVECTADLAAIPSISHWLRVNAKQIALSIRTPLLEPLQASHAKLPIEGAENSTLYSFRTRFTTGVHLALVIGDISKEESPLTRIHSSCVTGDILGSLRCDCGDQLHLALDQLRAHGSGILIYLYQEGRGIGITNKLRAYQLQERNVDTYDANLALGYGEDERDFSIATSILKQLGVKKIRLLTNNPHKMSAIEATGIAITQRVPLVIKAGKHNHAYLETKGRNPGIFLIKNRRKSKVY